MTRRGRILFAVMGFEHVGHGPHGPTKAPLITSISPVVALALGRSRPWPAAADRWPRR